MGKFSHVPLAPADPILGLTKAFNEDSRREKVNLGVGVFRDDKLHTPILDVVLMAQEKLLRKETSKEYLPIDGNPDYLEAVGTLLFGSTCWQADKARIAGFQTLGGTGALSLGATFLKEELSSTQIWIPDPSWPNHKKIFSQAHLQVHSYPYYSIQEHAISFNEILSTLSSLPPLSTVLFHGCCHNPTGADLTIKQWQEVCALLKAKSLIPFFDLAYQGLGEGIEEDPFAIRHALDQGLEMLISISLSKNFSLYAERVGALFVVSLDTEDKVKITSRIKQLIRTNYSNPPSHGAKIVEMILTTPSMRTLWEEELFFMRSRLHEARIQLALALSANQRFSHLGKGRGMFAFLGLTEEEVALLIEKYAIYMPNDGRINVCGLTKQNLGYVTQAIQEVVSQ